MGLSTHTGQSNVVMVMESTEELLQFTLETQCSPWTLLSQSCRAQMGLREVTLSFPSISKCLLAFLVLLFTQTMAGHAPFSTTFTLRSWLAGSSLGELGLPWSCYRLVECHLRSTCKEQVRSSWRNASAACTLKPMVPSRLKSASTQTLTPAWTLSTSKSS